MNSRMLLTCRARSGISPKKSLKPPSPCGSGARAELLPTPRVEGRVLDRNQPGILEGAALPHRRAADDQERPIGGGLDEIARGKPHAPVIQPFDIARRFLRPAETMRPVVAQELRDEAIFEDARVGLVVAARLAPRLAKESQRRLDAGVEGRIEVGGPVEAGDLPEAR